MYDILVQVISYLDKNNNNIKYNFQRTLRQGIKDKTNHYLSIFI